MFRCFVWIRWFWIILQYILVYSFPMNCFVYQVIPSKWCKTPKRLAPKWSGVKWHCWRCRCHLLNKSSLNHHRIFQRTLVKSSKRWWARNSLCLKTIKFAEPTSQWSGRSRATSIKPHPPVSALALWCYCYDVRSSHLLLGNASTGGRPGLPSWQCGRSQWDSGFTPHSFLSGTSL